MPTSMLVTVLVADRVLRSAFGAVLIEIGFVDQFSVAGNERRW